MVPVLQNMSLGYFKVIKKKKNSEALETCRYAHHCVGHVVNSYLDFERRVSLLICIQETIPRMFSLSDQLDLDFTILCKKT